MSDKIKVVVAPLDENNISFEVRIMGDYAWRSVFRGSQLAAVSEAENWGYILGVKPEVVK